MNKSAPSASITDSSGGLSIALAIYRLSPRGGLEDNCLRIAEELESRGHKITIFVAGDAGSSQHSIISLRQAEWPTSNHKRMAAFAREVKTATLDRFDRTIAFQAMPDTDFVFLADPMRSKAGTPFWKRLLPRFRTFARLEADCFSVESKSKIIGLTQAQMSPFVERYKTPWSRIRLAPPSISKEKHRPETRTLNNRQRVRDIFNIDTDATVWLWLGLAPNTKGLDRVVEALAEIETARLLIGGLAKDDKRLKKIWHQANKLGVGTRIHCLGFLNSEALLEAMAASDLLAHPARMDTTGAVILEAVINGLPVVASDTCGFSPHIIKSAAGLIISAAFDASAFLAALQEVGGAKNAEYSLNGINYGNRHDIYSGISETCDFIEAHDW